MFFLVLFGRHVRHVGFMGVFGSTQDAAERRILFAGMNAQSEVFVSQINPFHGTSRKPSPMTFEVRSFSSCTIRYDSWLVQVDERHCLFGSTSRNDEMDAILPWEKTE